MDICSTFGGGYFRVLLSCIADGPTNCRMPVFFKVHRFFSFEQLANAGTAELKGRCVVFHNPA